MYVYLYKYVNLHTYVYNPSKPVKVQISDLVKRI